MDFSSGLIKIYIYIVESVIKKLEKAAQFLISDDINFKKNNETDFLFLQTAMGGNFLPIFCFSAGYPFLHLQRTRIHRPMDFFRASTHLEQE